MKELWDNPRMKCASLPSAGNCGGSSVHAIVYVSRFMHAYETHIMCPYLCGFSWVSYIIRYVTYATVSTGADFNTIFCVRVAYSVDIIGYFFLVSPNVFH